MADRIIINKDTQKHIQAYIDYHNIVGDDDGGKMMSEKEFDAYKKKVAEARKNHLYVYWINAKGFECKAIGPESMCFCGHRYKSHNFDNVKNKKVTCKTAKCKCPLYNYVPVYGSNDVKCLCKHSYSFHDVITKKCGKCICSNFGSKFTCNCTLPFDDHMTTIENREERLAKGKTVDPGWMTSNLTAGIGGLNSFTGMVNDVYQLEYDALINGPDHKFKLMEDLENKKKALPLDEDKNYKFNHNSNITQNVNKVQNINNNVSAFDLFCKPHKYGGEYYDNKMLTKVGNKFGRLAIGNK
jgi:hypothetical protein